MRIIAFVTLIFLSTLIPAPLLFVLFFVYALFWTGYELIVLSFFIDAYFGIGSMIPLYTIASILLLAAVEFSKPYLLVYELN